MDQDHAPLQTANLSGVSDDETGESLSCSDGHKRVWIRVLALGGMCLILAAAFAWIYWPFLSARAGVGEESVEQRSVSDRIIYTEYALRAIRERPILGVGIGNFPWRASFYLQFTNYDLRGQPVHHVLLSAWSELGIVGLALTLAAMGLGTWAAVRRLAERTPAHILFFGGFVALTIIGLFDHYPWTLLHFQAAWWGLLAVASRPDEIRQLNLQPTYNDE